MKPIKRALPLAAIAISLGIAASAFAAPEVWVAENGNDTTGDGTKENPYAKIATGVANCDAGGTVWIKKGRYTAGTGATGITKAITIRGESKDPWDTVVDLGGAHPAFALSNAKMLVANIAVTNSVGDYARGAAFKILNNGGTVSNCVAWCCNSKGWTEGAAMYGTSASALFTHCVISNCNYTASNGGGTGGMILKSGSRAEKCLIVGCSTTVGDDKSAGGVNADKGYLTDCTIAGNTGGRTGGLTLRDGKATNCIIAGNFAPSAGDAYNNVHPNDVSRLEDCATSDAEPLTETCIRDFGDNFFMNLDAGDFRPTANPPVTYGYYDVEPDEPRVSMKVQTRKGVAPFALEFIADTQGFAPSDDVTYAWEFGGGVCEDPTSPNATATFPAGVHSVVLIVENRTTGRTYVHSRENFITVAPKFVYVVKDNPNAASPYADFATAAATMADAFVVAGDGSTLIVSNATFSDFTGLSITKSIAIAGYSGNPEDVIFALKKGKSGFALARPGVRISGITVQGGSMNNSAGIAFSVSGSGCVVSNCIVRNNGPYGYYAEAPLNVLGTGCLVTHCVITNNSCGGSGADIAGGVRLTGGSQMLDSLVADNRTAGGVYVVGDAQIVNCTIAGNDGTVGGVRFKTKGSGSVRATVVAGNRSTVDGQNQIVPDTEDQFVDCVISDTIEMFKGFAIKDYSPAPEGALVDRGGECVDPSTRDLAGNVRVQGAAIDIGAFESDPNQFSVSILPVGETVHFGAPATFKLKASGKVPTGNVVTYEWTFTSGGNTVSRTVSGTDEVTVTLETCGLWNVSVSAVASPSGASDSASSPGLLKVVPPVVHVVKGNASAEYPYDTELKAAADILTAIKSLLADGQEVVIHPETYQINSAMTIPLGVTVRGSTGHPEDVIIDRKGSGNAIAVSLNDRAATLTGVTVMRGSTVSGGGAGVSISSGTLSNCVVHSCSSGGSYDSSAVYANGKYAVVTHCVISNNTAAAVGAEYTAGGLLLDGGARAENCLIVDNHNGKGASIGKIGTGGGVALKPGTADALTRLINCTVISNESRCAGGVFAASGANANVKVCNTVMAGNLLTEDAETGWTNFNLPATVAFNRCAVDTEVESGDIIVGTIEKFFAPGSFLPAVGGKLQGKGDNAAVSEATDLQGNPRIVGRKVDVGCYESVRLPGLMLMVR